MILYSIGLIFLSFVALSLGQNIIPAIILGIIILGIFHE